MLILYFSILFISLYLFGKESVFVFINEQKKTRRRELNNAIRISTIKCCILVFIVYIINTQIFKSIIFENSTIKSLMLLITEFVFALLSIFYFKVNTSIEE